MPLVFRSIARLVFFQLLVTATLAARPLATDTPSRLWYLTPAHEWTDALPMGNGRLAAMSYGTFPRDRLQLNEETIWEGEPLDRCNPKARAALPQLREMIFNGQSTDAAKLIEDAFVSPRSHVDPYQTAGELFVDFVGHGSAPATGPWIINPKDEDQNPWILRYGIRHYQRDLDLATGIATSRGYYAQVSQQREAFVSWADDIICYRFICDSGQGDVDLSLQREIDVVGRDTTDNGPLILKCELGRSGRPFCLVAEVRTTGGTRRARGSYLEIRGASAIEVRIAIASSWKNFNDFSADPQARCLATLAAAKTFSWDQLKARHVQQQKAVFDRVKFVLPTNDSDNLPTNERLKRVQAGAEDWNLSVLYFNYGRYLLASSSREGGLPANLQGKWCGDIAPAWNSNYTTNINVQMNYWPAGPCNLTDRAEAYLRWAESLVAPGQRTARELYGCRGWTLHHNSDIYGATEVFDGPAGVWPMGSAWVSSQLIDLWRFNQDRRWLERAWPLAKGATEFILDYLVEAPANSVCPGKLVTNPSHSPENAFLLRNGKLSEFTYASTMDLEIIAELFAATREAIAALGLHEDPLLARMDAAERRLPPLQISERTGRLQEWIEDYDEVEPGHRHISHLFALHPGSTITKEKTPELFTAARASLDARIVAGSGGTGWSRAWVMNFYARFYDGANFQNSLLILLRKSTLSNLFDTHPPFQIDGNFGACAGIAEALLQSHIASPNGGYRIDLLPALPPAWRDGAISGLRARGGVQVDLEWHDGSLSKASLTADHGGSFIVRTPDGKDHPVTLRLGQPTDLAL